MTANLETASRYFNNVKRHPTKEHYETLDRMICAGFCHCLGKRNFEEIRQWEILDKEVRQLRTDRQKEFQKLRLKIRLMDILS